MINGYQPQWVWCTSTFGVNIPPTTSCWGITGAECDVMLWTCLCLSHEHLVGHYENRLLDQMGHGHDPAGGCSCASESLIDCSESGFLIALQPFFKYLHWWKGVAAVGEVFLVVFAEHFIIIRVCVAFGCGFKNVFLVIFCLAPRQPQATIELQK